MRQRPVSRRRVRNEDSDNVDRWLVSYADFITLLFAFFVVMYAISSVNEGKYRVLSDTMVDAFKTPPKSELLIQIGEPIKKKIPADTSQGIPKPIRTEPSPAEKQTREMRKIALTIQDDLQPLIDSKQIKVNFNQHWVEVEINTAILYSSGSAELEDEAYNPLEKLAGVIQTLPNYIDVEGHTDNLPISTAVFPSNWELSAARAASVVHLFTKNGVDPEKLSAIGYGEHHPIASNDTVQGRRQNRRVRVLILVDKDARNLGENREKSP